jgi:hypothetical protein
MTPGAAEEAEEDGEVAATDKRNLESKSPITSHNQPISE